LTNPIIIALLLMAACATGQTTILPAYEGSVEPAIRIEKYDTVTFLLPGYFVNENRYRMYQTLKKAAEKDKIKFSDMYSEVTKYIDTQVEVTERLAEMSKEAQSSADSLRQQVDYFKDLAMTNSAALDLNTRRLSDRVVELELELKSTKKTKVWPFIAVPVAFLAGFLYAK